MAPTTVTIIGAGPTGLSAALALTVRGCTVRVLERNDATTTESRAVGMNRRSLLHLATVGAMDPILAVAEPLRRARLHSRGKPITTLRIPQAASGPPTVVALPQSRTEAMLAERLQAEGVRIDYETEATSLSQTAEQANVVAQGPSGQMDIASDLVLGADGSHSVTRKSLGIDFAGHRYAGDWSLFDAVLDWPWPEIQAAAFLDNPDGIFFMITLGDGRRRVIGNVAALEDRVRKLMPVGEISWRNEFNLSERRVDRYGTGRIWIAGDAAHVHSPVGGMGMNLGIDDAFDFAGTVVSGDFDAFEQRRKAAADRVMRIADRGYRLMTARNPMVRHLRNLAFKAVGASPFIQRRLAATIFAADSEAGS